MSTITFLRDDHGGDRAGDHPGETVEAAAGVSVMRAAILNGIDGIIGECGGQAMCATCHVFVEATDGELPPIGEDESEMLECTAAARAENSRLGCQLRAAEHFHALTVRLPREQV